MITTKKDTDWGTVWHINDESGMFRFAVYIYDDDLDTLYLSNVYVANEHRGKGLGNKILKTAEAIAKQLGVECLCLKAKTGSTAYKWYKRHGYNDLEVDEEDPTCMWMKKSVA